MSEGKRWSVFDRYKNEICITDERWNHIIEPTNHPEMTLCEEQLKQTLRKGDRKQEALNPQKYRYSKSFDNLTRDNTHIIAIVLFRFKEGGNGKPIPNNYVVTAYRKEIG